ncbi:hypothetical protein PS15p_207410 [Mucor circinelloides]
MATRRLGTLNFIKQHLDTSVPHMTLEYLSSCVYLSYLMSTIFHREMLDESRWREIGRVLLRDRLNSIMLFIPSLIPGQDLLFAETLSRDTLCRHFPANIVDSCGSMAPPAQATLMSTSQVPAGDGDSPTALLELDTSFIEALRCLTSLTLSPLAPGAALVTPIILDSDMTFPRLSNGVSRVQSNLTHWNAAKNLFGSFPLDSERLVTLFVDLLMHEYLKSRTSNSWDKYLLSGKTTTDLYTLGPRVFKDGNYIRIFVSIFFNFICL